MPCPTRAARTLASCLQLGFTQATEKREAERRNGRIFSKGAEVHALDPPLLGVWDAGRGKGAWRGPQNLAFVSCHWVSPSPSQSPRFCLLTLWLVEVSSGTTYVNALGRGGGVPCYSSYTLFLLLCNLRAPMCLSQQGSRLGQRYGLLRYRAPWLPHRMSGAPPSDYRGRHNSQASQEKNPATCSFLLPAITDGEEQGGACGEDAGEGQLPLCPPALGLQVSIH